MRKELLSALKKHAESLGITPEQMIYCSRQMLKVIRDLLFDGQVVGLDGIGDLRVTWTQPRHIETAFGDCKDFPALPRIWFRAYRATKLAARKETARPGDETTN